MAEVQPHLPPSARRVRRRQAQQVAAPARSGRRGSASPAPTRRVSANRHTGRAPSRGTWRTGLDGPRCAGARDPRRLDFSAALQERPGLGLRATAAWVRGSEAGEPQPGSGGPQRDALPPPSARLPDSGHGKSAGQTGGPAEGGDPHSFPSGGDRAACDPFTLLPGRSCTAAYPLGSQRVAERFHLILSCSGE